MALGTGVVTCDVISQPKVCLSEAQESRLLLLDMHFPTLLTFRLQRPHIALQTFRFQHIISAHVTLLPLPSGPRTISVPMPQGYTERLAVMRLVGNTLLPSGLTLQPRLILLSCIRGGCSSPCTPRFDKNSEQEPLTAHGPRLH